MLLLVAVLMRYKRLMQRGARAGWTKDGTDNLLVLTSTSGRVDAIAFALGSGSYDDQQVDGALDGGLLER